MQELRRSLPAADDAIETPPVRSGGPGRHHLPLPEDGTTKPTPHWGYVPLKRTLDVAIASVLLLAALPLMAAVALLIRLDSPGPVIFRQRRVGLGGRMFWCYKFRTMVDGAESLLHHDLDLAARFAPSWKVRDDPRITRLGRWLRKTSIDELPQLLNVLRGEMSLVGPRPVQPEELAEHFGQWAPLIVSVRPGLTGLWQVSGRSCVPYPRRVQLEVEYVYRQSLWFDILILMRTVPAIFTTKGAL